MRAGDFVVAHFPSGERFPGVIFKMSTYEEAPQAMVMLVKDRGKVTVVGLPFLRPLKGPPSRALLILGERAARARVNGKKRRPRL